MLQRFHRFFYDVYLLSLWEQCKDLYEYDFENKMKVGDIVLIKNSAKTCPYWPLGRVLNLNIGDDGNVRSVNLKKGDRSNHTHSIKHLYPMELSLTHNGPTWSVTFDIEDFDRFLHKKKQKNPDDPYIWY